MSEPTPGTWTYDELNGEVFAETPDGLQFLICHEVAGRTAEESLANARLICANKDLLDACRYALALLESDSEPNPAEFALASAKLAEAIRKATEGEGT